MTIIEDNEDTSDIVGSTFESLGFQVDVIPTGENAVEKLKMGRPNIVILDLDLPGMPGHEIASKMLDDSDLKNVPVIVYSVHISDLKQQDALDTKYFWAQYQKTGNREPRIIKKNPEGNSILDLTIEVGTACGETYGSIPVKLMEFFKRQNPSNPPPFRAI